MRSSPLRGSAAEPLDGRNAPWRQCFINVTLDDRLARFQHCALTWDRYDQFLRSPAGDFSILETINAEVGREGFAVVFSDSNHSFSGDGAFRLLSGEPTRVG